MPYRIQFTPRAERDLAASFKVSRPTIREAMIALEIRGLVEARQGSGIYVTEQPPAASETATEPSIDGRLSVATS